MDDFVYPYDNAEREFAEPHFRRVFDVVRRHRRKIVVAAIFGIILLFFGSLVIPPEYTAKAQIVLETQAIDPAESTPPISQGSEEAAIQTEVTALTSHAFLKRVMNNLSRDPDYQAAALQEPANIHGFGNVLWLEFGAWFRHKVAQLVGLLRPRGKTARAPEQQRLDSFTREIKVYQDHSSDVIAVTFRATSPRQAAIAANQLTLLYIAGTEHRRRAQAQQVLARLDNRIREAKMALQRTETAAQNYRLVQGLADNKEGSLLDQKLTDLTRKLVALETGLAQRQAKLVAGRALQSRGSDAVVESLGSPADVELLRREIALQQSKAETASWAREKVPAMERLSTELRAVRHMLALAAHRAIDELANQVQVAKGQVLSVRQQIAASQTAKRRMEEAEPRLNELVQEGSAASRIYDGLLDRREELRTRLEITPPALRVLALASPPDRPSSFSPLLFILPGLILFSVGGAFAAVTAERLDRGLHDAQDVERALDVPCIGSVPQIRCRGDARPHQYLLDNPYTAYTEAIRSVAATLQVAAPGEAPKVILISSSVPNEGKTTLAVSFAVYAALIGRRALLVDFDFRHPDVSRELGPQADTAFRTAMLLGDDAGVREMVQHLAGLNLDYLPVRGPPGDPLLPFVSGDVRRLLHQLRDSYDCIVIDGPPLLAFAEARLLAMMADKVVLAVKWGGTHWDVARNAVDLLRGLGRLGGECCEQIAVVLTRVNSSGR